MATPRFRSIAAAGGLALALTYGLAGCSVVDSLHEQRQGTARSAAALLLAWSTPASQPSWVPADATRIRWMVATAGPADETPATVRADTASALPAKCTEVERRSLASFGPDWAPDTYPHRVERCGNWAVMRVDDGWFGWTPLAPVGQQHAAAVG